MIFWFWHIQALFFFVILHADNTDSLLYTEILGQSWVLESISCDLFFIFFADS